MDTGYVLNIQQYSLHDGPGIRTVVFLKGCPLQCKWCSNPESQNYKPELAYNKKKCIAADQCGRCEDQCAYGAIKFDSHGIVQIDHNKCNNCLSCADVCPSQALSVYGKSYHYKEIIDLVERENSFYARSGGGLTISGGEPLAQEEFTTKLLKEAKKRRINTAIETCGYAQWETLRQVAKYLDTIIYDIKSMNSKVHKEYTGVCNEGILENFMKLCNTYPNLQKIVRTPVVPGFNDTEDDIAEIFSFVKQYPNTTYEVLPYHRLGQPKYEYLGRNFPMGEIKIDEAKMDRIRKLIST